MSQSTLSRILVTAVVLALCAANAGGSCMCLVCGTSVKKCMKAEKARCQFVAVATVREVYPATAFSSPGSWWAVTETRTVRLTVKELWKGPRTAEIEMHSDVSARACMSPALVAGREYLLFGEEETLAPGAPSVPRWLIGSCNPTRPADEAQEWIKTLGRPSWKP